MLDEYRADGGERWALTGRLPLHCESRSLEKNDEGDMRIIRAYQGAALTPNQNPAELKT